MDNSNYNPEGQVSYDIEHGSLQWKVIEVPEESMRKNSFKQTFSNIKKRFLLSIFMLSIFTIMGLISSEAALSSSSKSHIDGDINLLARCVEVYAANESYRTQVAVASVVLNRIEDPSFPNTLASVLYQKDTFTEFASNNDISASSSALSAARDAMNGWDPSGSALFFFSSSAKQDESKLTLTDTVKIGEFQFCR